MTQFAPDQTSKPYCLFPGVLANHALHESAHFRVLESSGTVRQSATSEVSVDASGMLLVVVNKGSLLVRGPDSDRWWAVPPRSLILITGPTSSQVRAARGEHQSFVVSWDKRAAASLSNWFQNHAPRGR